MKIKTWRDPYDIGVSFTRPREIELLPGLTILVGCNGVGKSTLIQNIISEIKKDNIPYLLYDNLSDGSDRSISAMLGGIGEFSDDSMSLAANLWTASEGEAIKINLSRYITRYKKFLATGEIDSRRNRLSKIFADNSKEEKKEIGNKRFFFYDATDSGLSIDTICEIKKVFTSLLEDSKEMNLETYIIMAANEYELCRKEQCFDITTGKYLTFEDYEDYRKFIIHSANKKNKRLQRQYEWHLKQVEKEKAKYDNLLKINKKKIKKYQAYLKSMENPSSIDKYRIENEIEKLNRQLEDFKRHCQHYKFEEED